MRGLTVTYASRMGTVNALSGINLTVPSGSVFGFLGPNGAGKTTAMHVLLGFITPTSGHASIFGEDVQGSIARQRIGYLPEHPIAYRFLTGREYLQMAGSLFLLEPTQIKSRAKLLLGQLDLIDAADRRISTYSRGMMQRICLAHTLMSDPDLLILDEPTGGLDPSGRMKIRMMINDLRTRGKTIFFSSHELSEVELMCDSVAILADGEIVAEGKPAALVGEDKSLERYFLRVTGTEKEIGP